MHPNDKLGFGIIGGILLMIGGTYLLFRIFGYSYLIVLLAIAAWLVLAGYAARYFRGFKDD
ncbi:MAG: hypothetical protein ACREA9_16665 [Pyrinomonadaceae bacterium]